MKKRIFSAILILLLAAPVMVAQSGEKGKMTFGILAGVNFQNINGKNLIGDKLENGLLPGFHAGVNVQIPIVPDFYFEPGLLFSTKGAKVTVLSNDYKHKLSYIELPLNVMYKGLLGTGHVMLGFGPYLAYGITGNVVAENGDKTKVDFQNTVELSDWTGQYFYRPLDVGGNIFFGYELEMGLFFQFNAQLGMLKINPEYTILPADETKMTNTGFGLSAGFRF